jgi:hypothetical protein
MDDRRTLLRSRPGIDPATPLTAAASKVQRSDDGQSRVTSLLLSAGERSVSAEST